MAGVLARMAGVLATMAGVLARLTGALAMLGASLAGVLARPGARQESFHDNDGVNSDPLVNVKRYSPCTLLASLRFLLHYSLWFLSHGYMV